MRKHQVVGYGLTASLLLLVLIASSVAAQDSRPFADSPGSVSGKVIGTDGKPMKSIIVKLVTSGPQAGHAPDDGVGKAGPLGPGDVAWLGRGETTVATARTDDKGAFSMKSVRPGNYKLVVNATLRTKQFRMDVTVESAKNVELDAIKVEAR